MCLNSYSGTKSTDHEFLKHPLVSPALTTEKEILEKFPKTTFLLAGNDAFRDENYKFALKLIKAGIKVEIKELKLLPHGFLNYNFPIFGMDESDKAIELGTRCLKELLEI